MDREGFRNRLKQYKKAREENPGLKYWEWKNIPKYDEGTDGVKGKSIPTQEEYIAEQIAAEKVAALKKSLTRTMPRVPKIVTGEQWNPVTKKVEPIYKEGDSCAYTFADNYGLNWMGCEDFRLNHGKYGWRQIPWESRQPGDAVLIIGDDNDAKHTMMYDSDNAYGQPLFNHSNGGSDESAIRKKAKYPHHNPYLTYEFVGTPADSTQWINDYKKIYGFADGGEVRDNTYVAPIEKEQIFIPAKGLTKFRLEFRKNYPLGGNLEIVSPEFEILSGGIGIPRWLYEKRIANLAKSLVSKSSDKTLSKGVAKIKPHLQLHTPIGETFTVSEDAAKELSAMYHRNISSETAAVLSVLGKKRTPSRIKLNLNASEREWLRKHNVDETILSGEDIKTLKQLRRQSIIDAVPADERFILTSPTAEHSQLQLFKNTLNEPTQIGYIDYGTDPYSYMRYLGRLLHPISDIDLTNHVTVDMIENISNKYFDYLGLEKGVSKDLYNGLAHVMKQRFPENGGFVTGMKLISPEPTTKTLNKLNKKLISNQGEYHWATGSTLDNPIYSITNPTGDYPVVKSLLFDPKAIKNGKIITDLTNPDIHFAEGGEVTGPPTYDDWYTDITTPKLNAFDDAYLHVNINDTAADLHNIAMTLPGYANKWNEYQRSRPKEDPSIDAFVNDLWANENPNNVGYRNGKYYPHKSPEGGKMTIGPGFKLDSGSHGISTKTANRGMTKTRLNQEARKIGKQHLAAVDQFLNYGLTTNPADTVSPQIKMGLMDLRHQVGPLNEWSNLRQAVLEGDLDRIKKESTVTWNDNGKIKVDKRRKKIRDEKYFYYE